MRMTRALKSLYREYEAIQSDDPIDLGILDDRILQKQYSERTMRPVVGLLKEYIALYQTTRTELNARFAICFVFDNLPKTTNGPVLVIMDVRSEQCLSVLSWNSGKIQSVSSVESEFIVEMQGELLHFVCQRSRNSLGLSDLGEQSALLRSHDTWLLKELSGKNVWAYKK